VFNRQNLPTKRSTDSKRRNLFGACLTHIVHDGYTDQLYALLLAWQAQFGLSYMGLAVVRALYYGTMGGDTGRAFALFYTGVVGSGGLAPIAYGAIADHSSRMVGILASAGTALVIVPLILSLRRVFSSSGGVE